MVRAFLENLPEVGFTAATIRQMWRLVDAAKVDPNFQKMARDILRATLSGVWRDYRAEADALLRWLQRNVDYRRDPHGVELLQDWVATLNRRAGDCDDLSGFLAALLEAVGTPTRFVTVSTRPDREWTHVYLEAYLGGVWEPIDAIVQGTYIGWAPMDGVTAKKVWTRSAAGLSGADDDVSGVDGMGKVTWQDEGFASSWFEPQPPDGIPTNVSKTWAYPEPGDAYIAKRIIASKTLRTPSDHINQPDTRTGEQTYGSYLEPVPWVTPAKLFSLIPREFVPRYFEPDIAWWNKIPDWAPDQRAMGPQPFVSQEEYMRDLKGLAQYADDGILPARLSPLLGDDESPGVIPITADMNAVLSSLDSDTLDRVSEVVARAVADTLKEYARTEGAGLYGLGEAAAPADPFNPFLLDQPATSAGTITPAPGPTPAQQAAQPGFWEKLASAGIDAGLKVAGAILSPAQQAAQAVKPAAAQIITLGGAVPPWLLPLGLGVAFFAAGGMKFFGAGRGRRRYRYDNNPRRRGRRRSYGRRRRGLHILKGLLFGGAAVAGYMLLKKPDSSLFPAQAVARATGPQIMAQNFILDATAALPVGQAQSQALQYLEAQGARSTGIAPSASQNMLV